MNLLRPFFIISLFSMVLVKGQASNGLRFEEQNCIEYNLLTNSAKFLLKGECDTSMALIAMKKAVTLCKPTADDLALLAQLIFLDGDTAKAISYAQKASHLGYYSIFYKREFKDYLSNKGYSEKFDKLSEIFHDGTTRKFEVYAKYLHMDQSVRMGSEAGDIERMKAVDSLVFKQILNQFRTDGFPDRREFTKKQIGQIIWIMLRHHVGGGVVSSSEWDELNTIMLKALEEGALAPYDYAELADEYMFYTKKTTTLYGVLKEAMDVPVKIAGLDERRRAIGLAPVYLAWQGRDLKWYFEAK